VDRTLRTLSVLALVGLLAAILAFLVVLTQSGIRIQYAGDVRVIGMPSEIQLRFAEPAVVEFAEGSTVTAAVSGDAASPVAIAFASALCPNCGGAMLPVRYHPFTGKIEWACPKCDALGP